MFKYLAKINFKEKNSKKTNFKCMLMILLNLKLLIKIIIGYKWNKMRIINIQFYYQ